MTRFITAALLLLATTGCDAALGLPSDAVWADGADVDVDAETDAPATEADEDLADEPADESADGEEPFVPPFPIDGDEGDEDRCVFGEHVGAWAEDPTLAPGLFEHITHPADLSDLDLDQLEEGFARWDFFDFATLDEFFGMLEGGRVLARDVDSLDLDRSFTHLRMHFRGMEFGFVFVAGTDRPVAAVVDGDVVDCSVAY